MIVENCECFHSLQWYNFIIEYIFDACVLKLMENYAFDCLLKRMDLC